MNYFKRPLGLSLLILSIIMGVQVGIKKPLCISSKIVNKIDILENNKISTIYNCSENIVVPYSDFFFKNMQTFEAKTLRLEKALATFDITAPISIQIDLNNTQIHQKTAQGLRLGDSFLQSADFEKALFQYFLENKLTIQDQTFVEALADFYIQDGNFQNSTSRIWSDLFKSMSIFEKQKIKFELARLMSHESVKYVSDTEKNILNTLKLLGLHSSKEVQLIQNSKKLTIDRVSLDLIIDISHSKQKFEELRLKAFDTALVRVGIKDKEGLKMYPQGKTIPSKIANQIQTNYRIIFISEKEYEESISSYSDNTEKLIIMNHSDADRLLNIEALLKKDIRQFLYWNKKLEFVQIHLPSYRLKAKELSNVKNYFDFLRSREQHLYQAKVLGWSKIEWSEDLRAFKPLANFDVIQYFRLN